MQILTYARRIFSWFYGTSVFNVVRVVDALASTATAEIPVGVAVNASKLVKAYYLPGAALTADDTDYATITVSRYTAAGGSKTTIASLTTETTAGGGTDDWTAKVPVALTLSASTDIAAGALITYEVAKEGSGVALPAGSLVLVLSDAR